MKNETTLIRKIHLKRLGILTSRKLVKIRFLKPTEQKTVKRNKTRRKDKHTLSLDVKFVEKEIKKEKNQKKIKVQLKEIGNDDGTKWLMIIKSIKRIVSGVYVFLIYNSFLLLFFLLL